MTDNTICRREVLRSVGAGGLGTFAIGTGAATAEGKGEYNVGTASPAAERAARDAAETVIRVLDWSDDKKTVTGTFSEKAIENLANRPDVRYTEVNGEMHAIDAELDNSWGVDRVDAEVAHSDEKTGAGADIAIIDTGIDDDHTDLDANIGAGKAFIDCGTRHPGPPCNTSNCNESWSDDHDHGTHCAGIAGAEDNGDGVVGASTEATLHAVKVLDCNGSGSFSDVAAGIKYTADQGWDVGSMSLGGSKSDAVEDAVEYAYGNGVLLVAAAGNDGPCTDCVGYPAAEPEVIAVSATNKDDCLADFSSQGPEIELAAPGKDVYSTVIDGYDTFSGTSMACPHVSGAGGLLMASGYSNTEAREQLNSTAEDVGLSDNEQGNGLVDAAAALGLDSSDSTGSCGSSDNPPTVDSLSLSEVETDDSDAEFDADWQVSDDDGDLDSLDLTLYELDSDGNRVEEEDSATEDVSGDSSSGTTRLVASGDDGSGNTYEVEAVVTDSNGNTDSATATATESEGDSAPSASIDGVSEANSPSPHAEFDISWSASDSDDDLDTAELTLYDDTDSETEDSTTIDISGGSASGTTTLTAKFDEGLGNDYTAELVVTDSNGNSDSDTATFSES